jgi:hypothetical protein
MGRSPSSEHTAHSHTQSIPVDSMHVAGCKIERSPKLSRPCLLGVCLILRVPVRGKRLSRRPAGWPDDG